MTTQDGPLLLRSQLAVEETWDLTLLFKGQVEYEAATQSLREQISIFNHHYKGKLSDVKVITIALSDYEKIKEKLAELSHYGSLAYEADKLNEVNETNIVKLGQFMEWSSVQLSFFETELAQVDHEIWTSLKSSQDAEPYKFFLDQLEYDKPVLLDAAVEEALKHLSGSTHNQYDLYGTIKFQDMAFDDFQVEGKTYNNSFAGFEQDYEGHKDKAVRHAAWKSFHQGLKRYENTVAANYINHVETEKKLASLRGFDSVFDYLLHDQKVSTTSYNVIIDTLTKEIAPVFRRYANLLKEEQALEKVTLADIKMPFSKGEPAKITIEESRQMVEEALSVLGEDYLAVVKAAFDQRWIDYPMNQTKSTGGFCSTVYNGPSYILLNWTGLMSEVLVLAHELGHAGHFQLTYKNQSILTPEASLYFIEAPSTANEVIMCQYLLNQPIESAAKRNLLAEFVTRTYFHNMVTHLLEADFQRKVYKAVDAHEVLNAGRLKAFYQETLEDFWGEAVEINDGANLTWMRQPHYYMGLYPYTYSAGLTVGTQVGQAIAAGDSSKRDGWLEVLKAGGTLTAVELAAKVDVDMTGKEAIRQAIAFVDGMLDEIEALK